MNWKEDPRWAYVFVNLSCLMWASNFVLGRVLRGEIGPLTLTASRYVVASLLYVVVLGRSVGKEPLVRRDWVLLAVMGLTGIFGFSSLLYRGLQLTTATNGVLINGSGPLMTAVLAAILLKEKLSPLIGIGKLIDGTQVPGGEIQLSHVEHQVDLEERDFVFFRTDWNKFANTEKYYNHPELSMDVIEWLISKEVNAIGIDALGLGRGPKHGVYDRLLVTNGIFVIENLANLSAVTRRRFKTYCLPLKLESTDAIPARVLVELIDETDGKNSGNSSGNSRR